jgi:hypothetical protein
MNPEGLLLRGSLMGTRNDYYRLHRNRRSDHLGAMERGAAASPKLKVDQAIPQR